jgi:hypothetical protein
VLRVLLKKTAEPQSTPRKRRGRQINKKEEDKLKLFLFKIVFLCASSAYSAALRFFQQNPKPF